MILFEKRETSTPKSKVEEHKIPDEILIVSKIMQASTYEAKMRIGLNAGMSESQIRRLIGKSSAINRGEAANEGYNNRAGSDLKNNNQDIRLHPSKRFSSENNS